MTERSFAQIRWQQERLGLLLVNDRHERFFLHGGKLLELFARQVTDRNPLPEDYLIVKQRDRRPNKAIGYYGGEVRGILKESGDTCILTFYVGEPYRPFSFDVNCHELADYLTVLRFAFPLSEMKGYRESITLMLQQKVIFDERLQAAEATPLMQKYRSSTSSTS